MQLFLALIIISFAVTSFLIVPFINALYQKEFLRRKQETTDFKGQRTKIFDKLNRGKEGTPVGGGILLVLVILLLFLISYLFLKLSSAYLSACFSLAKEAGILFFTLFSFGLLGFLDDFKKIFNVEERGFFGLRLRWKFMFQWFIALIISAILYFDLGIHIVNIPFLGVIDLGLLYLPFATFIIVAFTNAFNITDGQDGLACGLLVICLFAFSVISFQIMDTPIAIFSSIWIGSLIAFLYFNVYPARIFLGDTGALAFGASLAVIGLILGKIIALAVIGGLFIIEIATSLIQILAKLLFNKKVFKVAPFHLWLREAGWEEPKLVMRAWLAGLMLAIIGLWLATIH